MFSLFPSKFSLDIEDTVISILIHSHIFILMRNLQQLLLSQWSLVSWTQRVQSDGEFLLILEKKKHAEQI